MALVPARGQNQVPEQDQMLQQNQIPVQISYVASFHPSDPHQAVAGFVLFELSAAA